MRRLAVVSTLLLLGAPWVFGRTGGLGKGEEPPGLYEMTARADLVVSAQVDSGSLKLAQVRVVEVFRGRATPRDRLQIAFREFNLDLGKEDRIVFEAGATDVLFLVPELNGEGKRKGSDRYTLLRGRFGKFPLPREGEEIYLEALRGFVKLVSIKDHRELFRRLKDLVESPNPILVNAALKEVLKLDIMDRELVPAVMVYYRDPAPARRVAALRLMERLFARSRDREKDPDFHESALPPITVLARNDPDETVRVAAVDALGAWGGAAVAETLGEIARQDSAQAVRYKAQVILLRESGKSRPRTGPEAPR